MACQRSFSASAEALSQVPPCPCTMVQMLIVAVEIAVSPAAVPSPNSGVGAIGNPVDLLILRSVLLGGIDGVKITFAPEDWISLLILRRLEGRSTPPVV